MSALAPALHAYEFWLAQYRRVWRGTVISSLLNPVFYLAALGIGLGTLVDDGNGGPGGVPYLDFVAPGLVAAAAMQVAATESSFPVMAAFKWTRQYHAMLATPLRVRDVLLGHLTFIATRVVIVSSIYLAAVAAFGGVGSPLGVLAVPVALLVGLAFAGPIVTWAASTEANDWFNPLFRFFIVPMFLFSGTFFPVTELPRLLEWVAYATPLWHGVDLTRQLTLGDVRAGSALLHVAYLLAWTVVGAALALRAYRRRLIK
ncbi:MAG TPA: ABC transporter permease [Gaiellaceae bacterium]|jgi:lipooligosaccharide transport system permease protein|nr:ABC transporter permease [Gaiellaceae bacterium]